MWKGFLSKPFKDKHYLGDGDLEHKTTREANDHKGNAALDTAEVVESATEKLVDELLKKYIELTEKADKDVDK